LAPVKQYTGEKVDGPLTLQVYRGVDGQFLLYEDDGSTFNFRKGEWMGIQMAWNDRRRSLTLRLAEGSRMFPPMRRKIEVRLVAEKATRTTIFAGRPTHIQF
jgi:alpha-glucosidase (family GH31 glycosyl hydrolase)